MNFITRSSLFILLNVCTSLAYAQKINVPEQWKTECIGNFQISVPGDV